jgi:hypothetical protein
MRRASSRFIPPASLAGSLLLILAPAAAAHADNSAAAPAADTTGMAIAVKNCNDSGPGSLRAAVASALSGDTIDMRGLSCRRINLTSGAILIPQDDLTLVGGGVTVDANRTSSVFRHNGTGWLRIRGMTIARGFRYSDDSSQPARGGCLYSAGSVELKHSLVHWCLARTRFFPQGGGIYAERAVTLVDSQILGNTANYSGQGSGIYTNGSLTAIRSRICGNHGGIVVLVRGRLELNYTTLSNNSQATLLTLGYGDNIIANSTISDNTATGWSVRLEAQVEGVSSMIVNSTISGNLSNEPDHTVLMSGEDKSIINSTIAFNRHTSDNNNGICRSGRGTVTLSRDGRTHIESTIAANNFCDDNAYHDIGGSPEITLDGANNLITSSNLPLPPDTISIDPRLAPLADNGGLTKTHALLDDSPAIDAGNNAAGLAYDQRGAGFPRVNGAQADIGAYER